MGKEGNTDDGIVRICLDEPSPNDSRVLASFDPECSFSDMEVFK